MSKKAEKKEKQDILALIAEKNKAKMKRIPIVIEDWDAPIFAKETSIGNSLEISEMYNADGSAKEGYSAKKQIETLIKKCVVDEDDNYIFDSDKGLTVLKSLHPDVFNVIKDKVLEVLGLLQDVDEAEKN